MPNLLEDDNHAGLRSLPPLCWVSCECPVFVYMGGGDVNIKSTEQRDWE